MPFVGELVALDTFSDAFGPRLAPEDIVGAGVFRVFAFAVDDRLLVLLWDLDTLGGGEEGRPGPGAVGAGREHGRESAAGGDAAGGEHRDVGKGIEDRDEEQNGR